MRYEEREVSLSHLNSLDFYVSYFWPDSPVAHTFVSFGFDNAPPISISIETRPEIGEGFDPIPSLFKQFELIYVVGDERDLVRVRTDYRNEDVFLYRLRTSPEVARRLFLVYLERINELADRPEFYHLFSNSCTINIVRYANLAGRVGRLDIRHVLNGFADRYLYNAGVLDTSLPFAELRERSHINEAAQAAGNAKDFSERIRKSLPTIAPLISRFRGVPTSEPMPWKEHPACELRGPSVSISGSPKNRVLMPSIVGPVISFAREFGR